MCIYYDLGALVGRQPIVNIRSCQIIRLSVLLLLLLWLLLLLQSANHVKSCRFFTRFVSFSLSLLPHYYQWGGGTAAKKLRVWELHRLNYKHRPKYIKFKTGPPSFDSKIYFLVLFCYLFSRESMDKIGTHRDRKRRKKKSRRRGYVYYIGALVTTSMNWVAVVVVVV